MTGSDRVTVTCTRDELQAAVESLDDLWVWANTPTSQFADRIFDALQRRPVEPAADEPTAQQYRDALLNARLKVRYANGYPIEAVPVAVIVDVLNGMRRGLIRVPAAPDDDKEV